jgi:hypothetical protein
MTVSLESQPGAFRLPAGCPPCQWLERTPYWDNSRVPRVSMPRKPREHLVRSDSFAVVSSYLTTAATLGTASREDALPRLHAAGEG